MVLIEFEASFKKEEEKNELIFNLTKECNELMFKED
jgi:hypothetical protein